MLKTICLSSYHKVCQALCGTSILHLQQATPHPETSYLSSTPNARRSTMLPSTERMTNKKHFFASGPRVRRYHHFNGNDRSARMAAVMRRSPMNSRVPRKPNKNCVADGREINGHDDSSCDNSLTFINIEQPKIAWNDNMRRATNDAGLTGIKKTNLFPQPGVDNSNDVQEQSQQVVQSKSDLRSRTISPNRCAVGKTGPAYDKCISYVHTTN